MIRQLFYNHLVSIYLQEFLNILPMCNSSFKIQDRPIIPVKTRNLRIKEVYSTSEIFSTFEVVFIFEQ
jgi:hypothetical protein